MKLFLKLIAYIFHPLFIPLFSCLAYYAVTPTYNSSEIKVAILLKIGILTILIPIIFYFLLKNLGLVQSIFLEKIKERKAPLYAQLVLLYLVLKIVMPSTYAVELYYFFVGSLATIVGCIILVIFNIKASIHMMGISGLCMFVIVLSVHYKINLLILISILIIISGLIASSRLMSKSHNIGELVLGSLLGLLPQLLVVNYWM
jgi:hypothetical protein